MAQLKFFTVIYICLLPLLSCSMKSGLGESNDAVSGDNPGNREVVCFVYHRFGDPKYPSTNISVEDFEAHLQYLKDNHFTVLNLSDALDYIKSNQEEKKVAVITIDDGYTSFLKNGLPLLKQFNFPATLFVNTETVGGKTYMGWEELKTLHKSGIEIGNHTHSHAFFLDLSASERHDAFERDIEQSQKLLKENLGFTPELFAYPYGEFDEGMKEIIKKEGFKAAAAQNSGVIHMGTDRLALPRFPMSTAYSAIDKFREKVNMKALKVKEVTPASYVLPDKNQVPQLTLKFPKEDLRIAQVQCFVQGGTCDLKVDEQREGDEVILTVKAEKPLKARRTLYTITVPSKSGKWHWYSHLWINADVKGE